MCLISCRKSEETANDEEVRFSMSLNSKLGAVNEETQSLITMFADVVGSKKQSGFDLDQNVFFVRSFFLRKTSRTCNRNSDSKPRMQKVSSLHQ